MRSRLDLEQLRLEIRAMTRTHALYRLLRDELEAKGFWRAKPRGNPAKGFQGMKKALSKEHRN